MAQLTEPETLPGPRREDLRLETVLQALGDPVRLTIVRTLYENQAVERPCGTFALPVAKSTASHHFRVLREAGVISQRPAGRERLTELRREDLEARFPGLLASVVAAA